MNQAFFRDIQKEIHEVMPKGTRVVLFGSQARGDAGPESDWDILILIDKGSIGEKDFDNYAYPLVELGWKHNEQVSPIMYTFQDWQRRKPTSLYHNIETEGVEICH